MSDNPHQRSPGQRIPAGMAVNDKLQDRKLFSQMGKKICVTSYFLKCLKVLYWNPTFKIQHAIVMDKCTFIHKGLMLFNNWFGGTLLLNVLKNMTLLWWLNMFKVVKW